MELNSVLKESLRGVFAFRDTGCTPNSLYPHLSLDNNEVFKKNLIIEVDKDEIEIPVIVRRHCELEILSSLNISDSNIKNIIVPLYDNALYTAKRTFDTIIKYIFTRVKYNARLQRIITGTDKVYYGGNGIILDESYTPLLLCTLLAKVVYDKDKKDNSISYHRPICYVNPKVFLEPNDLINKGIIKKIIPYYTNNNIYYPIDSLFRNNLYTNKVKVVIDNFDRFFTEPVKPTSTCSNDTLNECLIDNIDDIMMLV